MVGRPHRLPKPCSGSCVSHTQCTFAVSESIEVFELPGLRNTVAAMPKKSGNAMVGLIPEG